MNIINSTHVAIKFFIDDSSEKEPITVPRGRKRKGNNVPQTLNKSL